MNICAKRKTKRKQKKRKKIRNKKRDIQPAAPAESSASRAAS
jgi:hypothetical protein